MPEFYMILAQKINKIPKFYIIIARKIFFFFRILGGTCPLPPVSYAYVYIVNCEDND